MDSPYLKFGVFCSLVIHGLAMTGARQKITVTPRAPLEIDVVFDKSVKTPPPQPIAPKAPTQIVTPPDAPPNTERNDTASLLSDRDTKVKEERVKRGDHPQAAPVLGKSSSPPAPSSLPSEKSPPSSMPAAKLRDLHLDSKTISKIQGVGGERAEQASSSANASTPESYQAFSRGAGSGAQILGVPGAPDYLPGLPDGDLTLLNTKANQFAVFVRRVALRVFGELRASGWDTLSARDIEAVSKFSSVRTTISKSGELLKVEILSGSGSDAFDQVLFNAVKKGGGDQNPPPEAAAADGQIHFIFQARSWVKAAVGKRGAPIQRRWLLLGTGLE